MTQHIRVLPDNLCNKIAAGEVVERPASVVKELLENSIDAGATDILVEVEAGGKRLIKVVDNGCGMGQDDAFLSLERHATSKMSSEEDLFSLSTLGFRGEALPSIASVSRLHMRTRTADEETGWEIYAEGGHVKKAGEVGMSPGTSIEVRNLFFNLPARRKFLRREQTELGHLADVVTKQALGHSQIRFRLVHEGRTLLEAHPEGTLEARVATVLGRPLLKDLVPLRAEEGDVLRLEGLVSQPGCNRSTTSQIFTFINGRYIRDRVVQHAIMEGYRSLLMKGRYPVMVLFLQMDPELVDVNVHPTKHEVRFRDQRLVHDFITSAVRQTLQGPARIEEAPMSPRQEPLNLHQEDAAAAMVPPRPSEVLTQPYSDRVQESLKRYGAKMSPSSGAPNLFRKAPSSPNPPQDETLFAESRDESSGGFFSSLQVLGQYRQSYILCQHEEDLVLVDQHAAHERIRYEELRGQYRERSVERQVLLFPEVLEFDYRDAAHLQENLSDLERFGFEVDPFGGNSFAVKAIPQLLSEGDPALLLKDVVAELSEIGRSGLLDDAIEEVLMLMACHGSVRAKQALKADQVAALFKALDGVDFNANCPHGRPVMVRLSLGEVERLFKRT